MIRSGEFVVVVALVHVVGEHQLLGVVHAHDARGFGLGPGQGRQEHARQDGNDGNDDQQFDERKTALRPAGGMGLATLHVRNLVCRLRC